MKNVVKTIKQQGVELEREERLRVKKFILSRKEPRKTIQVRISKKWHERLKKEQSSIKRPLSRIMDKVLASYFKH